MCFINCPEFQLLDEKTGRKAYMNPVHIVIHLCATEDWSVQTSFSPEESQGFVLPLLY